MSGLYANDGSYNVTTVGTLPGTGATSLGKAEDAAHTSGDVGVLNLGVRQVTIGTPLAGADGDYIPAIYDAFGQLIVGPDGLAVSGTVTSQATLFTQDMLGYESISVQITSAGSTCTITYETSNDNSNWVAAQGLNAIDGLTTSVSSLSSSTTTGIYKFSRVGRYFRARVSTYGSGTVTVVAVLSKTPAPVTIYSLINGLRAHDATNTGNPIKIGGRARTFGTPYSAVSADDITDMVTDLSGNLKITSEYTASHIATATTTTVKSGAGVLHSISVNTKGTVASICTVYDNTTGSGTVLAIIDTLNLAGGFLYDITFATGLTLVTTGTVAPDITVSYR